MSPSTCCQLCLEHSEDQMDIFASSYKEFNFPLKISTIFCFLAKLNDHIKCICQKCASRVTEFYNYWVHVKQSQVKLAQISRKECSNQVSIKTFKKEPHEDKKAKELNGFQVSHINCCDDNKDTLKCRIEDEKIVYYHERKTPLDLKQFDTDNAKPRIEYDSYYSIPTLPNKIDNFVKDVNLLISEKNSDPDLSGNHDQEKKDIQLDQVLDQYTRRFPTELIRDGKMLIKRGKLDKLISQFYNLQCSLCENEQKFTKVFLLLKHIRTVHNTRGFVTCDCNDRLYSQRIVKFHMVKHLQPSAFECPICKKAVTEPRILKSHIQAHLPQCEKKFKCDKCGQSFRSKDNMKCHIESYHIPDEERKIYKCEICGKEYKIKLSLYHHTQRQHATTDTCNLLCSECGKSLQTKTLMKIHMLVHHDTTGKNKVQCKECGIICKNHVYLKAHEKLHSGVRFSCSQCNYSTHRKEQLLRHIRVQHTDERPFSCDLCGKKFKLKTLLNQHIVRHTGEAKYSCSFCSQVFSYSGNCTLHQQRRHPEEYNRERTKNSNEKFKAIESNYKPKVENVRTEDIHHQNSSRL